MANKIVLISEDTDFFEYITTKLELRKTDELFSFSFNDIPSKIHLLNSAIIIINSENAKESTLDLLPLLKHNPIIVCSYNNDDENYRKKCYRLGAFDVVSLLIPDSEFRARMIPIFSIASILEKNQTYRNILVEKELISNNNEVFINYNEIIDNQLKRIKQERLKAVFFAISPNEKNKFIIHSNQIETIILNSIRLNDILMNYAPNKYFLIIFDTDLKSAENLWKKIASQFTEKIYAGIINITNQNRQQLINDALNKLHLSINNDKGIADLTTKIKALDNSQLSQNLTNFKAFKKEFEKKLELVITPVFYQIQQKYCNKFTGVAIKHNIINGCGNFVITNHNSIFTFAITTAGFSKINIDIIFRKNNENIDSKRISIDPEDLETGLLEDLLEQFVLEYKNEFYNIQ